MKNDWLIILHIVTAAIGQTIFVFAFCISILYLYYYRKLKQKKLDKKLTSQSLSSLETLLEYSSIAGLGFLTLSLSLGLALIFIGKTTAQVQYLKILWSFLVWGWYVFTLFGRRLWGWRGYKGAELAIFGMFLLIIGLFGVVWQYI